MGSRVADNAGLCRLYWTFRKRQIRKLFIFIAERATFHPPMFGGSFHAHCEVTPIVGDVHWTDIFVWARCKHVCSLRNQLAPHPGDLLKIAGGSRFNDYKRLICCQPCRTNRGMRIRRFSHSIGEHYQIGGRELRQQGHIRDLPLSLLQLY